MFISPDEWYIKIEKTDDNRYKMTYTESKKVDDRLKIAIENTLDLLEAMSNKIGIIYNYEVCDDYFKVSIEKVGTLEEISAMLVFEFLPFTPFGRMSFSDVITNIICNVVKK